MYSLSTIADRGEGTMLPPMLRMAYIPQDKGHILLKAADEDDSDLGNMIKQAEMHGEKASEVKQSNESMNLIRHYDSQFHKSGKYDNLAGWLSENGYECPGKPEAYAAMNTNKDAVAFNIPGKKVLGANSRFEKAVASLAKGSGLKYDEALELALTHEYMHIAQPKSVLESKDRGYIESDAEKMLVNYFVTMMQQSKSKVDKQRYLKLANVAAARYKSIQTYGYPEMNNLENYGQLERMVALLKLREDGKQEEGCAEGDAKSGDDGEESSEYSSEQASGEDGDSGEDCDRENSGNQSERSE